MTKLLTRLFVLMCPVMLLSACVEENTPQNVAQAFWKSVISDDAKGVVEHSTLADPTAYEGFDRDWSEYSAAWGRIVIDGNEASVVTTLSGPAGNPPLKVVTHLVRRGGDWKVDYDRIGTQLDGGPLTKLLGQMEGIGNAIASRLRAASSDFAVEMERTAEQLEALSDSPSEQASVAIEQYGEDLRKRFEELAESVRNALRTHEKGLSDTDRQILEDVAADLDEGSKALSEASLGAIANSGRSIAKARQRLEAVDSEAVEPYKVQWRQWGETIENDMLALLDTLSARVVRADRDAKGAEY